MNKKGLNKILLSVVVGIIVIVGIIVGIKLSMPTAKVVETIKNKYVIDYAIYVDGKLYDSKQNFSFFEGGLASALGFASKKVDEYITNASVGDEINISLDAADAYGQYDESLRKVLDRVLKQERIQEGRLDGELSTSDFLDIFGKQPIVGQVYTTSLALFPIKVVNISSGTVYFVLDIKPGDKTKSDNFGFWFEVVEVNKENNTFKRKLHGEARDIPTEFGIVSLYLDDSFVYAKLTPEIGKEIQWDNEQGIVKSYNDTSIVIDNNHELAGKNIMIKIKILSISQEAGGSCKANDGPTMDVFIMSYCPFGLQILKGLIPVWKEFKDSANINVRFVSYIMHGDKEAKENARMACIREESCDKYISYLECFVDTGNADECISKLGIDKAKIDECIATRAEKYLAYDAELNKRYGVQGSPTVVINGKQVELYPRSAANIASKLCEYFTTKPLACNKQFSTANPAPGFGSGSASVSGGGSCG